VRRGVAARAAELLVPMIERTRPRLPHQYAPTGDWRGWLLLAGRGSGKTEAAARWVVDHVKGPPCISMRTPHRVNLIAPTQGDAIKAGVEGPSGLKTFVSGLTTRYAAPGGSQVVFPNGSEVFLMGAHSPEDVERLRAGGNVCAAWLEELAAWRYQDACFDHMTFGLRLGPAPRWVGSTTPKPRPLIKRLRTDHRVVLTTATTDDNPHLPAHVRQDLYDRYAGTQLGQQELLGIMLEEDEGALWRREWLARGRILTPWEDLREELGFARVSVGVDPSGGAGEQGVVVVAKVSHPGRRRTVPHGYVLGDRTVHTTPEKWGRAAVQAWLDFAADDVVVEVNFGGDMAVSTVHAAAQSMAEEGLPTESVPVHVVRASLGKKIRAQPVAALSEVNPPRWHMVGMFPELEDQYCTWTPEADWSPDRLDASVWPAWWHRTVSAAPLGVADLPLRRMTEPLTPRR
jgi:phage terminase large subunit-like protein